MTSIGIRRHLARLLERTPTIMLPLDDGLISGPLGHLADTSSFVQEPLLSAVDSILGFRGFLCNYEDRLKHLPFVMNISASTSLSNHTSKKLVATVEAAVRMGADAVAFHLNVSDPAEGCMLRALGQVVDAADVVGLPVVVIAYPRRSGSDGDDNYQSLRSADPEAYVALVRHTARIAVEMGASIVKTVYTGSEQSYSTVISAACGVPIIMAGGPLVDDDVAISNAIGAVRAGAIGVAFGRQVFMNNAPADFLSNLRHSLDSLGFSGVGPIAVRGPGQLLPP